MGFTHFRHSMMLRIHLIQVCSQCKCTITKQGQVSQFPHRHDYFRLPLLHLPSVLPSYPSLAILTLAPPQVATFLLLLFATVVNINRTIASFSCLLCLSICRLLLPFVLLLLFGSCLFASSSCSYPPHCFNCLLSPFSYSKASVCSLLLSMLLQLFTLSFLLLHSFCLLTLTLQLFTLFHLNTSSLLCYAAIVLLHISSLLLPFVLLFAIVYVAVCLLCPPALTLHIASIVYSLLF